MLPAASFAEKDGTFVNHAGLAQAIHWAVRPPGECRTDGQVFLDLLERRGLVHAADAAEGAGRGGAVLRGAGVGRAGRVWRSSWDGVTPTRCGSRLAVSMGCDDARVQLICTLLHDHHDRRRHGRAAGDRAPT